MSHDRLTLWQQALLLICLLAISTFAASQAIYINWDTHGDDNRIVDAINQNPNKFAEVFCPTASAPSNRLWGTNVYTADSSVCTAAMHAGLINLSGGAVVVEHREGLPAYRGSRNNGVTSSDYGPWSRSMVVRAGGGPPPKLGCTRGQGGANGVHWTWYRVVSANQGRQECNLQQHTFCALSAYQSGGINGFCSVGQITGDWWLYANDPDEPSHTQSCEAVCMDIPGYGIGR